jgi:hypothetical protein
VAETCANLQRRSKTVARREKARKVGRPKLPNGEAKGRIVPVRLDAEDLKLVMTAARVEKQTVSEWIRNTLRSTAEISMFNGTLHDAMKVVLSERPDCTASTSEIGREIVKRALYERKNGAAARASQINSRARKYPELFEFTGRGMIRLLATTLPIR